MSDPETFLEYNKFIADIESIRKHWTDDLRVSGCKVKVSFPFNTDVGKNEEYSKWCKANCNDKYYVYNKYYVFFKTEEDAMAFKLRFL